MKLLSLTLALMSLTACAHAPAHTNALPSAPVCSDQSESCQDAWYEYGDATGDYGVIDAAE